MPSLITRAAKAAKVTTLEGDNNVKAINKVSSAKTALFTAAETDNRSVFECTGTWTCTLPDASALNSASDTGEWEIQISNVGTGVITLARTTGGDTINGTATNFTVPRGCSAIVRLASTSNGYFVFLMAHTTAGTFTPTYVMSGTDYTSITYDNQSGYYTLINGFCFFQLRISTSNMTLGSPTGTLRVGGLPFTSGFTGESAATIGRAINFATNTPYHGQIDNNGTYITLRYSQGIIADDAACTSTTLNTAAAATRNDLVMSGFYRVA